MVLSATQRETLGQLEAQYQAGRESQRRLTTLRAYYHGEHPTQLTQRQREFLHHRKGARFCLNYCRLVADAVVERLRVSGFTAGQAQTGAWIREYWRLARLDALSTAVHRAALRDGETFLLADYDPLADRPRFTLQPADDGKGGLTLYRDAEGQPALAVKRWSAGKGIRRMNLYYPDRIEKYIHTSDSVAWIPFPAEGEAWPLPWVNAMGEPLGLPMIPFRARDDGSSELQDVIPLQDALNKTLLDLITVADSHAFPLYVARGFHVPKDFVLGPGTLVQIPQGSENGELSVLAGAAVSNFIDMMEHLVLQIARVSSTPLSRLQASGQIAAEGTLKQQEAGLIAKVEHKQILFGDAWEDALRLALRLQNAFGVVRLDEGTAIETLWSPAATRSESEHLQMLLLKAQLGVPLETLLIEAGYSEKINSGGEAESAPRTLPDETSD